MVVMKAAEQTKSRGGDSKKNEVKAILVAKEISFAKILAGNSKKLRDRGVKRLRQWLTARSQCEFALEEDDFMRLWKGLFYCMWMADKPLIQEELAETISSLVHSFQKPAPAIKFIETFFKTLSIEWQGIDQHRLEKFLMFVRRFLRQSLVLVERQKWDLQLTDSLCKAFESTLLPDHANLAKSRAPLGLVMHFVEIFLEELAKVSKGKLNEAVLLRFLRVFAQHIVAVRDHRIRSHVTQHIFIRLIEQSPVGLEFQEKFRAWKRMGFPGGSIDALERVDDESDNEGDNQSDHESDHESGDEALENDSANGDEGPLDPRAGAVHVELPLISFNATNVVKLLEEFRFKKYSNAKARKHMADMISKFEDLATGECPIGVKRVPQVPAETLKQLTQKAAEDLMQYESELLEKDDSDDDSLDNMEESDDEALENEEDSDDEELENEEDSDDEELENEEDSDDEELENEEDSYDEELENEEGSDDEALQSVEDSDDEALENEEDSDDALDDEDSEDMEGSDDEAPLNLEDSEEEDQLNESGSSGSSEDDAPKENNEIPKNINRQGKRKASAPQKSISKRKKVFLDQSDEQSNEVSPKVAKKRQAGKTKLKKNPSSQIIVTNTAAASQVDPLNGADSEVQDKSLDKVNLSQKIGTGVLLQHLAPHLTGINKSKRRASCGARLQVTADDNVEQVSDSPSTTQGKKMKKRISMWDEPLQKGEYEIVITKDDIMARKKRLSDVNGSLSTPKRNMRNPFASPSPGSSKPKSPGSSSKKVNFVLQKNKAQAESEYFQTLRENPDIPYDANKEPSRGVLKPSPYSSPVNPFYKHKYF